MSKITINQDSLKNSREWKRHSIKDGSNVYRILPPFGNVETHNNYPYRKWSIVWLIDPRTGRRRPFASPLSGGEENCPVREYQEALRSYIDKKKATLESQGVPKSQIKTQMQALYDVQWQIKVQHLYAYNACDKSGNVGLLEIKSTAHKALKKKMAEYISLYGQDPTSLNSVADDSGVWFNFTREGTGKETTYGVDFNKERFKDETGRLVSAEDRSPLAPNVVEGYNDQGYDLNTIYFRKNYNELRELLLYTLEVVSEEVPEVVLPGFEPNSAAPAAPAVAPAQQKVQGTKKVTINLDDDEDDDVPVQQARQAAPVMQASAPTTDADMDTIKDLADSILGD